MQTTTTQLDIVYQNLRILRHFVRQGMVFYFRAKSGGFHYAFVTAPPRLDPEMQWFLDYDEISDELTSQHKVEEAFERANKNNEMYFTALFAEAMNKAAYSTFQEYQWPDNTCEQSIRHTQVLEIEEAMGMVGHYSDPSQINKAITGIYGGAK